MAGIELNRFPILAGAVVIAMGFLPVPLTGPSLPRATWFEILICVVPLMPLAMFLLSWMVYRQMPASLGSVLSLCVLASGSLVSLALSALSGGGTELVLLHGVGLTLACSASVLLVSEIGPKLKLAAWVMFAAPVCLGVWSVATVPIAYSQARTLAAFQPFCLAAHSRSEGTLDSLFGLRGLSFYTTRSGYKIGDEWYFHGLLLIEGNQGLEIYNWSPRRMSFDRLERPEAFFVTPLKACEPRAEFLTSVPLIWS